ncbi:uncharacterized protein LOC121719532 isoform X1 [Alosa sapidissima]|uniref:uncharacterized protein LOC121719532 isoform X1 n=2 Tax=Alosa sapidissima TaxID=34773 RepID=UPI001C08745A|nr:uncharacterized protein LOC121719532 isoform X1 [Alosa sapidissima]
MPGMAVINAQVSELIRTLRKKGCPTRAIAKHLAMTGIRPSMGTIRRHCRLAVVEKKKRKPRKVTSQVMEIIDSILRKEDELPARKIKELLQRNHNLRICLNSVRKAVRDLGWNFGKGWMANMESCLAERTADLTSERARVAQLLAENASLKADLSASRAEIDNLRQEMQELRETSQRSLLMEEMRAGIGELHSALRMVHSTPVRPMPRRASTPAPELDSSVSSDCQMSPLALSSSFNDSIQIPRQWADVSLRDFGPEDHARLHQQSFGQVGRYGCLLFRHIISEENYQAWSKTTNWDGSKGKRALPQNVKTFVVATLKRHFPDMDRGGLKECVNKINEFLRTTRKNPQVLTLL